MTYGKKLIYDLATKTQREEELTLDEKADFDRRAQEHEAQQAEYAKVKYLDDRKRDKDWPTHEEKVDALIAKEGGDSSKLDAINARIKAIEAKYPGDN